MIAVLWAATVVLAVLLGIGVGYMVALLRTPAVLAKMQPDQIATLAKRTAERRQHEPDRS